MYFENNSKSYWQVKIYQVLDGISFRTFTVGYSNIHDLNSRLHPNDGQIKTSFYIKMIFSIGTLNFQFWFFLVTGAWFFDIELILKGQGHCVLSHAQTNFNLVQINPLCYNNYVDIWLNSSVTLQFMRAWRLYFQ